MIIVKNDQDKIKNGNNLLNVSLASLVCILRDKDQFRKDRPSSTSHDNFKTIL